MIVQITIKIKEQEVKDILVATLSDLQFDGFEEGEDFLTGYINKDYFKEEELKLLLSNLHLTYFKSFVKSRNWNEEWESSFTPVVIEDFCSIRASFHNPIVAVEHEIVITPKMSFGTGHHATTFLMVQQMKDIDFKNKTVADFGTGTGILSILAEKLGSALIWAIDNDEWSIDNAKENIDNNGCKNIRVEKKGAFLTARKFDIILANINRNVILANLAGLAGALQENGILLISGILKDDEELLLHEAQMHNLQHLQTVEKDNWISIKYALVN